MAVTYLTDEIHTDSGYAAKSVTAPTGYVVVGGGYRWINDGLDEFPSSLVVYWNAPNTPPGDGTTTVWLVKVKASEAGTLRVWAMIDEA